MECLAVLRLESVADFIGIRNYGTRRDNCAIADFDARHNEAVVPYPDIVSNDGVAFVRKITGLRHKLFPSVAENLEGISGNAGDLVVCAVHNELDFTGYGAKLSDNQTVANEWKMIEDVSLKILRIIRIVVIGVIPEDNIRIRNGIFDETYLRKTHHWMRH